MKIIISILASSFFLFSCNDSGKPPEHFTEKDTTEKQHFFPVTAYLKGEVFNIKKSGVNPLKFTTVNEHTDSVWLKIEDLDAAVQEFLRPVIDSANLISLFTEKSFMDQSINAVTLTYDAAGLLPDSMKLKHWDVYIDPQSGNVKRIYMVKEIDKEKTLQLTWVSNQWCKITSFVTDDKGVMKIEKEEKLIWDF
jgi:hypothetical protein